MFTISSQIEKAGLTFIYGGGNDFLLLAKLSCARMWKDFSLLLVLCLNSIFLNRKIRIKVFPINYT